MIYPVGADAKTWRVVAAGVANGPDCPYLFEGSKAECEAREKELEALKKDSAKSVFRMDAGELLPATKMTNGWLKVDARLTRTGIFEYRNSDGSMRRELRLPEEVFHPDALASFGMVPVTDEHPPVFLSSENTRAYSRGAASDRITKDGTFVRAPLLVTDASLIEKMDRGTQEVSCGYRCDLDFTPGEHEGKKYDAVQRNIRGNHVAIVPRGRAGPEARVRMDGAEFGVLRSEEVRGDSTPKEPTVKISIRGITFDVADNVAEAIQAMQKDHADSFADLKKAKEEAEAEKEKKAAKNDELEKKIAKLDADLAALPAKMKEAGKARADLELKARKVLGAKAKIDAMDDKGLRLAVLSKLNPEVKFDGKSDAYLEARFDHAIETVEAEDKEETTVARRVREDVEPIDENEDAAPDADKAHAQMVKDQNDAWKKTLEAPAE